MNNITTPIAAASTDSQAKKMSVRYLSLDVLRGLTIALMVVVNNPGSWGNIYAPFEHASWHGFTPTDLVFPTFLFVVGNAMSFSMRKFENQPESVFLKKVFSRTVLIFVSSLLLTPIRLLPGMLMVTSHGKILLHSALWEYCSVLLYVIASLRWQSGT
jgi:predicted acyltransferase